MPIFKNSKYNDGWARKTVSAFLPKLLRDRLNLFSLYKGQSKSTLVESAIVMYLDSEMPVGDDLWTGIAEKALELYEAQQKNFTLFKNELRGELKRKEVDDVSIQCIMVKFEQLWKDKKEA